MKVTLAEVDRETLFLLPPSVQDWLPKGHLARFVVDIVEQLDLRSLKASYSGHGSQPYNPEMLVVLHLCLLQPSLKLTVEEAMTIHWGAKI